MRIESYEPSVGPATTQVPMPSFAKPVASAFTAVPEAMTNLGNMGMKIAGMMEKHVLEQNKIKDEAVLSDLDTSFRTVLQDKLLSTETQKVKNPDGTESEVIKGYLNRPLSMAKDSAVQYEADYADLKKRYLAQARTPEMRAALSRSMDSHHLTAREMVIKNEVKQSRLALSKSFDSSIEQQKQDAVAITDPNLLTQAVLNIKRTQGSKNVLEDVDSTTGELNQRKVAGDLVAHNVTAMLQTTGDLAKTQAMLDTQKDQIGDERYLELTKKLSDGYTAIQRQAKVIENTAKIQSRYEFIGGVANGTINWSNIDQVKKNVALKDPELAEVLENMTLADGQYVPTTDVTKSIAFMGVAKNVMNSASPEEASQFLVSSLKGKNGGNISLDRLGSLVNVAKEHAAAMDPNSTQNQKNDWSLTKAAVDAMSAGWSLFPPAMVYKFLKNRYDQNLQGKAITNEAKKVMRQTIIQARPELNKIPIIPNKVIGEDGTVETLYEGNLGEYGDFTRDDDE